LKAFSNIVGKKVIGMAEIFASKYERDNFLSIHHDKNNGDYAFILSLTENWNPVHGGNTHFVDEHKSIYKTVSPKFNTLTIFKLSPDKQMDHFVSRVCCSKSRYAFTGWFHIEK
jgi:Rps23 Pro-64 3,4-dihydroxylase Tpa1-like proline 4-hydroxylase